MIKESIFLIGPMGAGKSTVGRILADKLGYLFMDSDQEIETRTGVTIPVIFDIEGEKGFRSREAQVIEDLTKKKMAVLATGGGAVINLENRKNLRSRGFVVYLRSSIENLVQRTRNNRNRPLLQTANPVKTLKKLLLERSPYYEEVADLIVETEQTSVHQVVREIISKLEKADVV